ncbi:MAG: 5-formyltetrahydrofolate cyclo-ligase [Bermanella sp.]
MERNGIRQHMREQRRQLTPQQQLLSARNLSQLLLKQSWFHRAKNIAMYLANDGEIDPRVFADVAHYRGKQCLLPSMHPLKSGHLWFGNYDGVKVTNKFGIDEPDAKHNQMLNPKQVDIVLLPLVAFDGQGGRLGMGGGFYDRTFEFLNKSGLQKPKLIGLAHHFQQIEKLPIESWDVPLSAIITDEKVIIAR